MPDSFSIRQASPDDLDVLARLFDGYRQFYHQDPDMEGCSMFMKERLLSGDSYVLLAVDDGEQGAGFVQLYPVFSSVRMKRVWILNDLYVAPSARGNGVASRLMAAAESLAREHGVASLQLETAADNAAAKSLYDKRGWILDTEFHHYSVTL